MPCRQQSVRVTRHDYELRSQGLLPRVRYLTVAIAGLGTGVWLTLTK